VIASNGGTLALQFRARRLTLAYQGERRFLSVEPIVDGGPRISVRFPKDEPAKLFIPLNFEEGDPVEVFTRATPVQGR
jgi:hypothetical protein